MASDFQSAVIKTVQGIGYLSTFILSLVITIPMSMNQDQFKGRCLLFSTGQWQEIDGQFLVQWASQAYCNFTIFVAVIMFVISVIQFARFVKFLRRGRDSSFFSAFVDVLVCLVMVIFVLIAGCFTSVGFKVWCDEMEQRFPTCSEAGGSNIDKADGIDSSGFFFQMSVANFGIWVSFTMWIILLTFSLVKLCRYHKEENLRVSMAKERKRLLNEDLVSEVPVNTSYHEHNRSRRSRRNQGAGSSSGHNRGLSNEDNDERFQEITAQANIEVGNNRGDCGLVNDVVTEDFQQQEGHVIASPAQQQSQVQQPQPQSGPAGTSTVASGGVDMNVSVDDESLSSMNSSRHSYNSKEYNSLPKGNQIHIDQRPDLLPGSGNPWQ